MSNLHPVQMQIIRELIFHPNSKFSDLNITDLTNDHFSYHIRKLLEDKLVIKNGYKYKLSQKGKMFGSKMDTSDREIEKQPKVSVLICAVRNTGRRIYYAVQQRLKEPYYGYYGFMTGKIRCGEKIFEAAKRELSEEMGLSGDPSLAYVLHEMVYNEKGEMLEDKYFHCVRVQINEGNLKEKDEGCKNSWMSEKEFYSISPKYHNEEDIFKWFKRTRSPFIEQTYFIKGF